MDNCLRLLAIADMYQAERLKTLGMELVVKNMDSIVTNNSEDWKQCVKTNPDLVVKITEELAKRKAQSKSKTHPTKFIRSILKF